VSLSAVHSALLAQAATALSGITYGHENAPLTKPTNAKWGQVFFLPNQPSVETLGLIGQDGVDGIMQIDMNYPQNSGAAAADSDFETVRGSFKAGTSLTASGQVVTIISCGRSSGRLVDQWYRVSFTVGWRALIPR
jgi:hypothetical protein